MKGKLIHLDCVLPFLFEAKNSGIFSNAKIICFDENFFELYEASDFYKTATNELKIRIIYKKKHNDRISFTQKLIFYFQVVTTIIKLIKDRKVLVFGMRDISSSLFFSVFFRHILKFKNFKPVSFFVSPYYGEVIEDINKSNNKPINQVQLYQSEKCVITTYEEFSISSDVPLENISVYKIGTVRAAKSWVTFIKNYSKKLTFQKNNEEITIFWPLSVLNRRNGTLLLNIDDTIEEVLSFFSSEQPCAYCLQTPSNYRQTGVC